MEKRKEFSICRVTHALYPDVIGGFPIHCHELSQRQTGRGYDVVVLTWRVNKKKPPHQVVGEKYSVIRLDKVWMPWDSLRMENPLLPTLPMVIKNLEFDLIHVHSHLFWTSMTAIRTAKSVKKPVVTTVHGVMAKRTALVNCAQRSYLYTFGSWALRNSTRIICLTRSDAAEIMHFGVVPEKVRIIPNAVNTNLFEPGEAEDANLVIWVGRLVHEKGLKYLLRAAKIVSSKRDVRFLLVGEGPLKGSLMNIVLENGLGKTVLFGGKMSQTEVAKTMGKASLFVLPSLKEGFPKTLLEAMACGKPVVAFDIPGIREIVKDNVGMLVPPREPNSMAKAIISLLNDENLRHDFGDEARKLVLKKYSWDLVIDETERVYNEAINERK